ncbi:MAG: hypothetical protein HXY50_09855 [Ignavibacteriaceae bacterium]|nr:hypothetical protein [Ignavibacteriaceae bacterium]
MIFKDKLLGNALLIFFFIIGWIIGLLPFRVNLISNFDSFIRLKKDLNNGPIIRVSDDYVSPNQHSLDILHYDLNIDLYPKEKKLKGIATITGRILTNQVDKINLNFYDNLEIKELILNDKYADYKNEDTDLEISANLTSLDTFVLKIVYEGTPKRSGFSAFTFGEINGASLIYNLNEPSFASTWFPCNDIPSDKALLDIRITNDSSQTSVSNGKLISIEKNEERSTYYWKTFYPISTYLVCIYSSNYIQFEDRYITASRDTLPIKYFVLPDHLEKAKVDFKNTPKMIECFSKMFGEYPFIKEKYGIAEFLWQMGAMEHQTITGIGSNFVSGNNFFEDIYVHELAHHWWGNAVGPATWKDIWLNEGFSTYSEAIYAEYKAGKDALKSTMISKFSDDFVNTLYNPGKNLFSTTIYDKGAWVLHMLRWEVGDSTFFQILRTYFDTYKYKSASTNDFIKVCENISGRDLTDFFNQWVFKGTENITLDYEWYTTKLNDGKYKLTIELIQQQVQYNAYTFKLEVKIEYEKGRCESKIIDLNDRKENFEFVLDEKPKKLSLDPDNWLLANFRDQNEIQN